MNSARFLTQRARLLVVTRDDGIPRGMDAPHLLSDGQPPRMRQAVLLLTMFLVVLLAISGAMAGIDYAAASRVQPVIGSTRNAVAGFVAITRDQGGCPAGLLRAYVATGGAAPAAPACWHRRGADVELVHGDGNTSRYPAERFGLAPERGQ